MAIYTSSTYFDCIENAAKRAAEFGVSLDTKIILFCEDKLTLSLEKALVRQAGGAFGAEVSSFGRYISLNAKNRKTLSKEGSAMAVKKILTSAKDEMRALCKYGATPTLAQKTSELIAQLKSAKVTPTMLLDCVEHCPPSVSDKIHDIGVCFERYERFLKENNLTDSSNSLSEMLPQIDSDDKIKNAHIIIVGYSSVTKQSCDVMEKLLNTALSVDFFAITGDNKDLYTDEFLNFAVRLTGEKPIALRGDLSSEACRLLDRLYRADKYEEVGLYSDKLHIYEGKTVSEEVEYATCYIQNLVINGGYRYSDIAVAIGNATDYLPLLERKFGDYGIPYFSDKKRSLSSHPLATLSHSAIKCVTNKRDLSDVKKVINSSLFIPEKGLADKFTRLLIENSVTYKLFLKSDDFIPDEKNGGDNFDNLVIRQKRQLLVDFINSFPQNATAVEFVNLTENFIVKCCGVKKDDQEDKGSNFALLCRKLSEIGAEEERSFLEGGKVNFFNILAEIKDILGDERLTADEFLKLLVAGEEASEISLIPEYYDSVYLSEMKNCRYKKYPILVAIGLSGDIPFVKADTALLLDSDISKLDELSVSIEPKIRVVNRREKEATALALASFSDNLVLTYSLTTPSGKATVRSEIVDYIERIFSDDIYDKDNNYVSGQHLVKITQNTFKTASYSEDEDLKDAFFYSALRPAMMQLLSDGDDYKNGLLKDLTVPSSFYWAIKEIENEENLAVAETLIGKINQNSVEKIRFPYSNYFSDEKVSATVLETYFSCPYKCFLKYGVGISDSLTAEISSLDFGNVMHGIAEKFTPLIDKVTSEEECKEIANKLIEEIFDKPIYAKFLNRSDYAYSFKLLKKEAEKLCVKLYRESNESDFKTIGNEIWFADWSKEFKSFPLKTKKGAFKLYGKADRLDAYGDYVRIIDYKTGDAAKKSSNEKFYTGQNLQLYLYLNAFTANGKKPAGAYYYAVNDDFSAEDDDIIAMYGKTLEDDEVIKATDSIFKESDDAESKIVKVNRKTSKKTGTSYKGNVAKGDSLSCYMKYAKLMAESAVNDVLDGVVIPSPYKRACDYCEFGGLCGRDKETGYKEREVKEITENVIVDAVKNAEKEKKDAEND